jgi:hypothetical protein
MTIYQIKHATRETAPFFFEPKTLKFFGQTVSKFKVRKHPDGRYRISQPITDYSRNPNGENMGETVRFYNPITHELDLA